MATVAFVAIAAVATEGASVFVAAAATAAAAAAGAYIDSTIVYPALFGGPEPIVGPRVDGLRIQSNSEGDGMNICYGPACRVAGTIIWQPELIEDEDRKRVGKNIFGGGGQTVKNYSYRMHAGIVFAGERPTLGIERLLAGSKVILDDAIVSAGGSRIVDSRVGEVRVRLGGSQQTPDPTLESYRGVGNVPAFRNRLTCFIINLQLATWGNQQPNFNAIIRADESISYGEVIQDILTRFTPLTANDIDVSDVEGCVEGYYVKGIQVVGAMIEPLLIAGDILVANRGSKLAFFSRSRARKFTINDGDAVAIGPGDQEGTFTAEDIADDDLPQQIDVQFFDSTNDFQLGVQSDASTVFGDKTAVKVELPMTLSPLAAKRIATRLLWRPHLERIREAISLPPRYAYLYEGDMVTYTLDGATREIRIDRISIGANGHVLIGGPVITHQYDTSQDVADNSQDLLDGNRELPYVAGDVRLLVLDLPSLSYNQATTPGFFLAAALEDTDSAFLGGLIYEATGAAAFYEIATMGAEAPIFTLVTAMPAAPNGNTFTWDTMSEVVVDALHGPIQSAPDSEVLDGVNMCHIGGEIFAFANATPDPTIANRYTLSRLLRGRRGTENAAMTGHAVGSVGVVIDDPSEAVFIEQGIDLNGTTRNYKAVAEGLSVDDVDQQSASFAVNTLRPFSPVHVKAVRDGSNNATISWTRRTRAPFRMFGGSIAPLLESQERYEVDVYNPAGTSVVRTLAVTGSTSVSYPAADQTSDGYTAGDPIKVKAVQLSDTVGRGNLTALLTI